MQTERNNGSDILLDTRRKKRGLTKGAGIIVRVITDNLDALHGEVVFTDIIKDSNKLKIHLTTKLV